MILENYRF